MVTEPIWENRHKKERLLKKKKRAVHYPITFLGLRHARFNYISIAIQLASERCCT